MDIAAIIVALLPLAPEVIDGITSLAKQYQQAGVTPDAVTTEQVDADLAKLDQDVTGYDQAK